MKVSDSIEKVENQFLLSIYPTYTFVGLKYQKILSPIYFPFFIGILFKRIYIFALTKQNFINLTLKFIPMYQLKSLILVCFFVFISVSAFAQTPTDRANFLTEKMNVLLNLTADQVEDVRAINLDFYLDQKELKEKLAQMEQYQSALANQGTPEEIAEIINKVASVREKKVVKYNKKIQPELSESQYAIFIQNQMSLFQSVITEFGE